MGTFETFIWMALVATMVGMIVCGIAVMVAMAVEAYEVEARMLRKRIKGFFAERKEAGT